MPRQIDPNEPMHTYGEWLAMGYQVQRNQHHIGRDESGRPLFGADQVRPRNTAPPNPNAYQQRPRRMRSWERSMPTVPDQVEIGYHTYTFDYATFNNEIDRLARQETLGRIAERWANEQWNRPPPEPEPEPETMDYAAEIAVLNAQHALTLFRQRQRRYVPVDDPSAEGFKKLCAIERKLTKEK